MTPISWLSKSGRYRPLAQCAQGWLHIHPLGHGGMSHGNRGPETLAPKVRVAQSPTSGRKAKGPSVLQGHPSLPSGQAGTKVTQTTAPVEAYLWPQRELLETVVAGSPLDGCFQPRSSTPGLYRPRPPAVWQLHTSPHELPRRSGRTPLPWPCLLEKPAPSMCPWDRHPPNIRFGVQAIPNSSPPPPPRHLTA